MKHIRILLTLIAVVGVLGFAACDKKPADAEKAAKDAVAAAEDAKAAVEDAKAAVEDAVEKKDEAVAAAEDAKDAAAQEAGKVGDGQAFATYLEAVSKVFETADCAERMKAFEGLDSALLEAAKADVKAAGDAAPGVEAKIDTVMQKIGEAGISCPEVMAKFQSSMAEIVAPQVEGAAAAPAAAE